MAHENLSCEFYIHKTKQMFNKRRHNHETVLSRTTFQELLQSIFPIWKRRRRNQQNKLSPSDVDQFLFVKLLIDWLLDKIRLVLRSRVIYFSKCKLVEGIKGFLLVLRYRLISKWYNNKIRFTICYKFVKLTFLAGRKL